GLATSNLNVRVDRELRARFEAAVEERAEALGYRATITHVVKAWLIEKYDIAPAEKLAEA
ncbi:hypothetical protein, partial [Streptomyces roseoviridis]